ncbi:MAG: hypothetical protein JWP11_1241 [Frankiales bacterium]|nr:hypothetical protein [Frankiales bacterium]
MGAGPSGGRVREDSGGDLDLDLHQLEAAVHLGMSPTSFAELLDRGVVPSYLGRDGRHRRVTLAALEAHRADRFALRQDLSQQARAWRRPSRSPESETADVVIVA